MSHEVEVTLRVTKKIKVLDFSDSASAADIQHEAVELLMSNMREILMRCDDANLRRDCRLDSFKPGSFSMMAAREEDAAPFSIELQHVGSPVAIEVVKPHELDWSLWRSLSALLWPDVDAAASTPARDVVLQAIQKLGRPAREITNPCRCLYFDSKALICHEGRIVHSSDGLVLWMIKHPLHTYVLSVLPEDASIVQLSEE